MKQKILLLIVVFSILLTYPTLAASERFFFDGEWHLIEVGLTLLLDGERVNTDIPPIIINDRTYAPARALFEKMGAEVSWDEAKRAVTISGEGLKIVLTIDSKVARVNGRTVSMDVAPKIVADANVIGRTMLPVRFVAETLGFTVGWNEAKRTVTIDSAPPTPSPTPTTGEAPAVKKITNRVENGADIVEIEVSKEIAPRVSKYTEPDRLVLDFEGFTLTAPGSQTGKAGLNIQNVRYAYHAGQYTRVVIDLKGEVKHSIKEEKGKYVITITGAALKNIAYSNAGSPALKITTKGKITENYAGSNSYSFAVEDRDLGRGTLGINDLYIKSVEATDWGNGTLITVNSKAKLEYTISEGADEITITFKAAELSPVSLELSGGAKGKTVVLDAGHGGSDPGAIVKNDEGVPDIYEKEINLDITLKAAQLLRQAGANVVLTRDGDFYPTLEERVEIANSSGADIFVSIHNNTFTDPSAKGHIVFYFEPAAVAATPPPSGTPGPGATPAATPTATPTATPAASSESTLTSRRLAEIVIAEMTKIMGTQSRGVQDGTRYYVVRNTKMPAILIECAFLTNPEELKLLMTDDFREKIARGVAEGVIRALNETFGE